MTLTSKQIGSIAGVVALGVIGMMLVNAGFQTFAAPAIILVALAAAAAVMASGSNGGSVAGLDGLADAVRRAAAGEHPNAPAGASPEIVRAFDELATMADRVKRKEQDHQRQD